MAWLSIISDVLALIRMIAAYVDKAQEREIGRLQATSEALTFAAEELRLATQARFEATQAHNQHPNDDGGFDDDFKRKD